MESSTWQVIIAVGLAAVLQSVAYWIREAANGRARVRMESKIDGNTALTATSLVSSGNLPKAAPCIPAVAKAVSGSVPACQNAVDYATIATNVAHDTMSREGIPVQSQDLLVDKLRSMLEETATKEARHNEANAAQLKVLRDEIERLKEKRS